MLTPNEFSRQRRILKRVLVTSILLLIILPIMSEMIGNPLPAAVELPLVTSQGAFIALVVTCSFALGAHRPLLRRDYCRMVCWSGIGASMTLCLSMPGVAINIRPFVRAGGIVILWPSIGGLIASAFLPKRDSCICQLSCNTCGYDLRGNVSKKCPECGTDIPDGQWALLSGVGKKVSELNDMKPS